MSKWTLLLSSIALVAYVGYSLVFLPSKMEQNSVIPLNTERLDLLEKEIQNSTEPEALRAVSLMMVNGLKTEQYNEQKNLKFLISAYLKFDQILAGLLLVQLSLTVAHLKGK